MTAALVILLVVLGVILYRNREFWFPDNENSVVASKSSESTLSSSAAKKRRGIKSQPTRSNSTVVGALENRTAEHREPQVSIEVVGINGARLLRPRNSSIEVNLNPSPTAGAMRSSSAAIDLAIKPAVKTTIKEDASEITNANENARVSVDTSEAVEHGETPDYPLLARQMKIKGSVILDALIGRDGIIQSLDVVSGAPILADAAKEAVRKWHFKPHQLGVETVEASTKIKVNFVISTY